MRKIKDFNNTSEQILCVREHCQNLICVTVEMGYDCCHTVSELFFKAYILDRSSDISQACIGKSPCCVNGTCFEIVDLGIDECYRDQGYGSLFLTEILKFAKCFSVNKIRGIIYRKDIDSPQKKERLYHFYKKHGFIIDDGRLILDLCRSKTAK